MHRPSLIPGERDPFIDLVRVCAIVAVAIGHWATTTIVWSSDWVDAVNALEVIPETRLATWVLQVMPLVFFAGGFANAVSLARAPDSGRYLQFRMQRLLIPTAVFLAVWLAIGLIVELTDPQGPGKVRAAETAALPLWFLGIYLVVVATAPAMWRLHLRARWWAMGGLVAAVALVDAAGKATGISDLGGLNYALVWLAAHQLGFFYADGTLPRLGWRGGLVMSMGGLGVLVLAVTAGGYAVSLVGVPGGVADNAEPPTLAMVAATAWLVGLVLSLRPAALRWLERPQRRKLTGRVHRRLLTIYLWHITALMFSAGLWRATAMPEPAIGSSSWWALRPIWVLAAFVPLAIITAAAGRFEFHPTVAESPAELSPTSSAVAALGVFAVSVGLLGFGETGFLPLAPVDGEAVLMFDFNPVQNVIHLLVGALLLSRVGRRRWRLPALIGGAATFLVMGGGYLAGLVDHLGMNQASAVAHLAVGGAALLSAAVAGLRFSGRAGLGSGA